MASSSLPSLLVFGSQTPPPSPDRLARLRVSLLENRSLESFRAAIVDLENTWSELLAADSSLQHLPQAQKQIRCLRDWVEGNANDLLTETANDATPNNTILTPLTVIIHIIEYFQLLEHNSISHAAAAKHAVQHGGSYQGFCTGLLAAVAMSSAATEAEAIRLAAVALRLALVIGVYVDLDSYSAPSARGYVSLAVRWSKDASKSLVADILKDFPQAYISVISETHTVTVTVDRDSEAALTQRFSEKGVIARPIALKGRFHSNELLSVFNNALSYCQSNAHVQFPQLDNVAASFIRSASGAVVAPGSCLEEVILRSILLDQYEWNATIRASVADVAKANSSEQTLIIADFGDRDSIPRSLITEHKAQVVRERASSPGTDSDYVPPEDAVAIVGVAGRFAGADSLEEYWQLLQSGISMMSKLPEDRFPRKGLRRTPKDDIPFYGHFLRHGLTWDHKFFGKSSRESASMDPQQKLVLEVAYEALESAAFFHGGEKPSNVGCYLGVATSDYEDNVSSHSPSAFAVTGTLRSFISGKISHFFGFDGPSLVYDTACSSSAVAIHAACKAIQAGECPMALAGGVNAITSPNLHQNLAAANFLSSTGECKAFDAKGDGYCRGEGAGLVVLKKYSEAIKDGDQVFGVIVGSALNQNDNCAPITVPVAHSQARLFKQALGLAKMDSSRVSYVEAHGTGTPKGDPTEYSSIREVFGDKTSRKLHFGSVKPQIGHLEAASGVAALIKVLLMMQKRRITPQACLQTLNPNIPPLADSNMEISLSNKPWEEKFLAAAVNNYGAAGNNSILVVCEAPGSKPKPSSTEELSGAYPVMISAQSPLALQEYCKTLQAYIGALPQDNPRKLLADLAYGLSRRQNSSLTYAFKAKVDSLPELQQKISAWSAEAQAMPKPEKKKSARPIVLVFSGQTGNTVSFSEDLYRGSALLRSHLDQCDTIVQKLGGDSIIPRIFKQDPVLDTVQLHCMMFALQYSCAKTWIDSGLKVASVIGHSFGQLTALCVAGAMSLEDGLRLIYGRANLIKDLWGPERGAMLSVDVTKEVASQIVDMANNVGLEVEIACYNAPNSHIITGSSASIDSLQSLIGENTPTLGNVKAKRLEVTHAFHSRFVDALLPGYRALLEQIEFSKPSIPVETCSEGLSWSHIGPAVVARQTREPVFFSEAVRRIELKLGSCVWVEAGSGTAAIPLVRRALQLKSNDQSSHSFHTMKLFGAQAAGALVEATLSLWNAEIDVRYWNFSNTDKGLYSTLLIPPYQFEKHRNWLDYVDRHGGAPLAQPVTTVIEQKPTMVSLLDNSDTSGNIVTFNVNQATKEFQTLIKGHDVLGHPLCPVSLYVEIASRAASLIAPGLSSDAYSPSFESLKMFSPLGLNQIGQTTVTLEKVEDADYTWKFTLASRQSSSSRETKHATAIIAFLSTEDPKTRSFFGRFEKLVSFSRTQSILDNQKAAAMQGPPVYKVFDRVVKYSEIYRGVEKIAFLEHECAGLVNLPGKGAETLQDIIANPLAVDNFTQVAGLHINGSDVCADTNVYICTEIEEMHMAKNMKREDRANGPWLVYSSYSTENEYRDVNSDVYVFDSVDKTLVMMILGLRFTRTNILSMEKALARANSSQTSAPKPTITKSVSTGSPKQLHAVPMSATTSRQATLKPVKSAPSPAQSVKQALRKLLQEVADVPADEIKDDSQLEEIGIDSLMATEVVNAIAEKLGVTLSLDEFAGIVDFGALCQAVQPGDDSTADSSDDSEGSQFDTEATTPVSISSVEFSQDELSAKLQKLLSEHIDVSEDLSLETQLVESGIDSLSIMELGADIEKEFGVKVDVGDMDQDFTFGNLIETIISTQSGPSRTLSSSMQQLPKEPLVLELPLAETSKKQDISITVQELSDFESAAPTPGRSEKPKKLMTEEVVEWRHVDGLSLKADVFYPKQADPPGFKRPIALMIHGGGHVMLSRKDVRPRQTRYLLDKGLLPISIDYRLCPEVALDKGPMVDACDALAWCRSSLHGTTLSRNDINPDGSKVVVVGWSTGGTLALTTAFTSLRNGIKPPDAILAFYCPSDYESDFWTNPNYPEKTTAEQAAQKYDLLEGIQPAPVAAYNVPFEQHAVGGWLSLDDPRSRIVLHMNWKGQALPTLLDGLPNKQQLLNSSALSEVDWQKRPIPSAERVAAISPLRQIRDGAYRTPTFLIHGTADDLVPWQHSVNIASALHEQGVPGGVAVVPDAVHLLDLYRDKEGKNWEAVMRGYGFLLSHIGL